MENVINALNSSHRSIETPCYLYSVSQVADNFNQLKSALGTELIYSMKANNNIDLLMRCSHHLTGGIEIASIGELNSVAGGNSEKYINNPSADKKFLRAAIASRSTIIIDNLTQLTTLETLIGKRPLKPILLRLNPCLLKRFNADIGKIRSDQFGMDWDTTCQAIDFCREHTIPLAGFHVFNGSYQFTANAMGTATAALSIIQAIEKRYQQPLSFVNLGGGFGEHWQQSDFDFQAYRELLATFPEHITIAHETGRGLMASAGYFLTRVRYIKNIEQQQYAICDGGMNQNFLLAKTENSFRRFNTPTLWSSSPHQLKNSCTYVGSSCSKDDVIGKQSDTDVSPQVGDICIYDNCGAYNASYTLSPFLTLPNAKTFIIE
ncbi:MAG: amino acid decarboxylase [Gammaproteobacteria bacterium MedPE]|nr:MAG: amino acid decarboxylase [Gammaproteobacteria bacterium MedPE]